MKGKWGFKERWDVVWENQKCASLGKSLKKRIAKWTYAHWIQQEAWKFSRAKSNPKVMEQWQNCSVRKAGGEVETSVNLRRKVQGMFHMKVGSHADLFVWKHLSIYDIVRVNQNAFDVTSNWVTELPYILNSLPHLVTFLVHQNIG